MNNVIKKVIIAAMLVSISFFSYDAAAKPVETVVPHIYIDTVDANDWFLNESKDIIFAGYGSPLFPDKKTHYLNRKTIQYGRMNDGRLVIKCNFNDMYEFAIFYKDKQPDGSHRARFIMRATVDGNTSPLEVDSVLANFNGQDIEPFPTLGTNIIPARVVEMLYFLVKGEKYYGDLQPKLFVNGNDILNPYTQDLYDRCVTSNPNNK